ncbi:hypothetical protein [Agilicoccus flavus]|uniref:hypothetical protein n=1 Tax=Agilicoccus flavus TaxID=2775968 RepID=UPI001CF645F7|nr:hypothetical protein [Agilicoccus flavus]
MTDEFSPLEVALTTARSLKPGTWESVETMAMLAAELRRLPESRHLLDAARATAQHLKPGTWQSVRALTWLGRAERELGQAPPGSPGQS